MHVLDLAGHVSANDSLENITAGSKPEARSSDFPFRQCCAARHAAGFAQPEHAQGRFVRGF